MTEQVVVYDDFSGGEFGDLPPHQIRPNMWSGSNVFLTRQGRLSLRPGARDLDPPLTLSSGDDVVASGFIGSPASSHWVAFNDVSSGTPATVRFRNLLSNSWDASRDMVFTLGTADLVPGFLGVEVATETAYFINPGHAMWRYDVNGTGIPATTQITLPFTPDRALAKYKDRLFVSAGNRVYYSNAGDFNTFASDQWFDVGFGPHVRWMGWQRDVLVLITQDSAVWEYRGTPGRDSLRRSYRGERHPWVFYNGRAQIVGNDDVVFIPVDRDYPAYYRNGQMSEVSYLNAMKGAGSQNDPEDVQSIRLFRDDEVMFTFGAALHPETGKRRSLMYRNGAWCYIDWGHIIFTDAPINPFMSSDQQGVVYMQGEVANNMSWSWDSGLDRPGFSSDTYAQVGDYYQQPSRTSIDAHFRLPDWWSAPGESVIVKEVQVDFVKYETGQTDPTHFDVELHQLALGQSGTRVTQLQAFDETNAGIGGGSDGVRDRHKALVPPEANIGTAGFFIKIDGISAVAIEQIRVRIEVQPAEPRDI